jgi:hypothetical protein
MGWFLKKVRHHSFDPFIYREALKTSFVVGTLLVGINLGGKFLRAGFSVSFVWKGILTYFVPYTVSTYTALKTQLRLEPGNPSPVKGVFRCENCLDREKLHLETIDENDIVPSCEATEDETTFVLYDQQS